MKRIFACLAVVVLVLERIPRLWKAPVVLVALLAAVSQQVRTPAELALQYAVALAGCAAVVAFCWWFGRANYLAFALVFWLLSLRAPLAELFGNDLAGAHTQAWIVAAVLAVTILWLVLPAVRNRSQE